jgi:hypothetical protein
VSSRAPRQLSTVEVDPVKIEAPKNEVPTQWAALS